jgi:hypothetical protein
MPQYCGCCGKFMWPNDDPPKGWERLGSQLGAEALKSLHGLRILGLDPGPCIVMLDDVPSALFLKLEHFIMSNSDIT